jgi:ribonuclease HI
MPMIASDGSSLGTPGPEGRSPKGPGAYAVVVRFEEDHPRVAGLQQVMTGGKRETTTGEIELMGFLHALRTVRSLKEAMEADPISSMMVHGDRFTIVLDSEYVVSSYEEHLDVWVENRWKTSSFRAIKNQILWQDVHDLRRDVGHLVELVHQKGHTIKAADVDLPIEVELNDVADKAAGKASRQLRDTGTLPTQEPMVWLSNAKSLETRAADMRRLQAFAESVLLAHGRAAAVEAFKLATAATGLRADPQ